MDYLGRIREEEASLNDSSLQKQKKPFKKQKANSIVYGDAIHNTKEGYQQKISGIANPLNVVRTEHTRPVASAEFPKKNMSTDKVSYNHELHKLLSTHKKIDSFDKNNSLANRSSFQFKNPGRSHIVDSVSKRSPSFSNSNLPTDLPSNKLGSISNSSRPLFSGHKPNLGGKEKTLNVKTLHPTVFEDFKAYSHFKNSMQNNSKVLTNIKYPYFQENANFTSNYESERTNRTTILDEGIFEKMKPKSVSKWKEDIRKKVDARRNISKSPLQNSEFYM